jgi:Rrf2 family protein
MKTGTTTRSNFNNQWDILPLSSLFAALFATRSVTFSGVNSQLPIALHILGFLASQRGEPLTSEVMAETYGTSPVVLRRVLAKLQRAGLIETRRGVNGGSTLARPAERINLRQAYEAVASDPHLLQRHPDGCGGPVAPVLARFVNDVMGDAEEALLQRLEAVTVAEMDLSVRPVVGRALRESR